MKIWILYVFLHTNRGTSRTCLRWLYRAIAWSFSVSSGITAL